jgi:tRNA U34 5-methylaminomethyl-2-thiouridine-forming methyltransferase MnmC
MMPAVGDHVRPEGKESDAGIYRVVGTGATVTLLRVADAADRRVHSGEVRRVPAADFGDVFSPAEDPDAGFTPVRTARNVLSGMYWDVRRFL